MHPDSDGLAHNIALGHLPPDTAITTVVTVITHHEVMAWSNNHAEIADRSREINLDEVRLIVSRLLKADL